MSSLSTPISKTSEMDETPLSAHSFINFQRARPMFKLREWWSGLDWTVLSLYFILLMIGMLLIGTASPAVCIQHQWSTFMFVKKHAFFLIISLALMAVVSAARPQDLIWSGWIGVPALICVLLVLGILGWNVKGAARWLNVGGFSLQPSEFLRPCLTVLTAYALAQQTERRVKWVYVSAGAMTVSVLLLVKQPDFGMAFLTACTWGAQAFLGGLPLVLFFFGAAALAMGCFGAYTFLPHVAKRITLFLDKGPQDRYGSQFQIFQSLESFKSGGVYGVGLGEGTVKRTLPDAHADFIFSVACEELGALFCGLVLILYVALIWRLLWRAESLAPFQRLVVAGVAVGLGLQVLLNLASVTYMIPPKGITLPFLSYGGSSLLANALNIGIVLSCLKPSFLFLRKRG